MKKSLIIGLLSLACGAASSFGQGVILLDNYNTGPIVGGVNTGGPLVTYGSGGIPANGVSGAQGTVGTGLLAGWTFGFYYAVGNVSVGGDPTGISDPSTLGPLTLATGSGSTAAFYTSAFNNPGMFLSGSAFAVPGTVTTGGDTLTVVAVAYSGASYASAAFRAHSTAFTMTTSANNSPNPNKIGDFMPAFALAVPEPSVFALAGLGATAFMCLRRRNRFSREN